MPMTTKLGTMGTYNDKLSPMKSYDLLIMLRSDIIGETKNIFPLPQCPLPPELAGWSLNLKGFYP